MKVTIKRVLEEGMIVHLGFEGDAVSTKGRGRERYLESSCELVYRFEDENGDEWGVVNEDSYPTLRIEKVI